MGFSTPAPPPVDIQSWQTQPYLERIKPLTQAWAVDGWGTPWVVYLLYIVKAAVWAFAALLIISATPGLGGIGDFSRWWTQPIVFQKLVVWTVLWEMLGLGSSSFALGGRYSPPIGGVLSWLRLGTMRLPAWPNKMPFTRGARRTPLDVALYAGVLGFAVVLLAAHGSHVARTTGGRLDPGLIGAMLGLWAVLGLRDKVSYMSGRPEIYGIMLVVSLFPPHDFIVGWQIAMLTIWVGAASSKLNHHFPAVIAVMICNTPWQPRFVKRRMWRNHPTDLRPSREATLIAHLATATELCLPLIMFFSRGGTVCTIAVIGMVAFHSHINATFPNGIPFEWNFFMIFGVLFLFGHYGSVPLDSLTSAPLLILLVINGVAIPLVGNVAPRYVSFLSSMRYYAGNWAITYWLFAKDAHAEELLDARLVKSAPVVTKQLTALFDRDMAELAQTQILAWRSMHLQGRMIGALLPRGAVNGQVDDYDIRDGELLAGVVLGWNFGDGHWHGHQLLAQIQEICQFSPGEVRVIALESQPIHKQQQEYQIWDAADGLIEAGYLNVADTRTRQPWLGGGTDFDLPIHVSRPRAAISEEGIAVAGT